MTLFDIMIGNLIGTVLFGAIGYSLVGPWTAFAVAAPFGAGFLLLVGMMIWCKAIEPMIDRLRRRAG